MSQDENAEKEIRKLNVETQRRLSVAEMKSAGYLIELIESKRSELKQKGGIPLLLSISMRLTNLQNHLSTLNLDYYQIENGKLKLGFSENKKKTLLPIIEKMIEAYERIRFDLVNLLEKEDISLKNFLQIEHEITDFESKLMELRLCVGQLSGFVLGKLAEAL
ncbi:hypothetical protein E3J74_03355 [Candidatus Bathyarchaeota archaeon]|nr:MAG: hypothetical protein E3J74_03355 [Candidatus Bathyarchaeota archaeon]